VFKLQNGPAFTLDRCCPLFADDNILTIKIVKNLCFNQLSHINTSIVCRIVVSKNASKATIAILTLAPWAA